MKNISIIEWVFIITCLFLFEILTIVVGVLTAGAALIITLPLGWIVWILYYGYLWFRGVKLGNAKMLAGALATLGIESLPIVGWLPSLTLNAIYTMIVSSLGKKANAK